ncbi:Rab proteins geranylgeranyltransferase component A [Ceratocystis fimbriata CBS 114723]|uniref:Rab proteins geranylgeranyltransferase n=1 Tax=Ceratocystis fimbriata CBS 114723 TaxID=1035309 RepID=A0A2C5X9K3_9PEZI|nr:Rab proteins geranylgeranyltransferase component A [Ceratocystis fimbriata CBS 114723]
MESLADEVWDVVINGTGLQQSLLALALSRSNKKILHLDCRNYYGGPSAALTLDEAEAWAIENAASNDDTRIFRGATFAKCDDAIASLGPSRAYTISLAPQMIHCRSELVAQLVSSRVFRCLEFLAVGSFFVYQSEKDGQKSSLVKLPSTREDIFLTTTISAKAKRGMMKFLKLVLDYDSEENKSIWKPHASDFLSDFLASSFKLDSSLQTLITTLTLSLDDKTTVQNGILAIHRHLNSTGVFGPGFAAVYPKFGGLSEVVQAGCRACAVGGAAYVLGTGVKASRPISADDAKVEVDLIDGVTVKSHALVTSLETPSGNKVTSKLVAVVDAKPESIFQASVEGTQTPAVAVVAFPAKSLLEDQEHPVYAMLHSSDTGECPVNQCIIYLSSLAYSSSKLVLSKALESLLFVIATLKSPAPKPLVQIYYEQADSSSSLTIDGNIITVPCNTSDLAFGDDLLKPVREAWEALTKNDEDAGEYMKFVDREPVDDE